MRRGVVLSAVVGAVVVAAATGWAVGSRIRSPADVAADAAPPEPSNITVEVERRMLSADVITRADVVYDEPVQVSLSGSFAGQPEALVVTQAAEVDSELTAGDLAVEVTGRPVFLLQGEIPMYRDLRPGAAGEDVLQLEQALRDLGFLQGRPDETWTEDTGDAVAAWYAEAGYRPNGLSREEEDALAAARDRVRAAERGVADAEEALRLVGTGPQRSTVLAAEAEITAARDDADLARLDAARANEIAVDTRDDAKADLAAAERAATRAGNRLTRARGGTHPDTGGAPTPDELAALEQAVIDAEDVVDDAEDALAAAEFDVTRVAAEQAALVRQARNRVAVAEATLADLQTTGDTAGANRQVDLAWEELTAARTERSELAAELGTWLPAGEIVFLPRLPVRVNQVAASRGSVIEGPFLTVSGSEVTVRSSVSERDAALLEEGMEVEIENPESDTPIGGAIVTVAERPGTNGVASDRVYIEITPESLPDELIGANVRVTIAVSSTGGEVLAVPAAALSATADGSTRLEVEDPDGSLRTVVVEPGLAAGGLVQVTPVEGEVEEGDLVVVGRATGD